MSEKPDLECACSEDLVKGPSECLYGGNPCEGVLGCYEGYRGKNYDAPGSKRAMIVLNHADIRIDGLYTDDEYLKELKRAKSGEYLEYILNAADMDFEDVLITNLYKGVLPIAKPNEYRPVLPGMKMSSESVRGVKVPLNKPKKCDYERCYETFLQQLIVEAPKKIVFCGGEPVKYATDGSSLAGTGVESVVLTRTTFQGIDSLLAYHPSKIWALRNEDQIERHISVIAGFLRE